MTTKAKQPRLKEDIIKPLIGLIVIIAVIIGLVSIFGNKQDSNEPNKEETTTEFNNENTNEANEIGGHIVSESASEDKCQDAGLLGQFFNLKEVSIIKASDYNLQYNPMSGEYDKDRNTMVYTSWHGFDKKTNQPIMFICWVSGPSDEDITIHYLKASEGSDSADLVGTPDFVTYNKDGNPIE